MKCDTCEYALIEKIDGVPTGSCMFGNEGTSYNREGINHYYRPDKYRCPKEVYDGRN